MRRWESKDRKQHEVVLRGEDWERAGEWRARRMWERGGGRGTTVDSSSSPISNRFDALRCIHPTPSTPPHPTPPHPTLSTPPSTIHPHPQQTITPVSLSTPSSSRPPPPPTSAQLPSTFSPSSRKASAPVGHRPLADTPCSRPQAQTQHPTRRGKRMRACDKSRPRKRGMRRAGREWEHGNEDVRLRATSYACSHCYAFAC
jgi:hypothetical protein